jgi:WhiB family redox-sensing transcriptional regulator
MTTTTRRATTDATPSPDWMEQGLCRQTDPEIFFPEGRGTAITTQTDAAKRVCNKCPVRARCLNWALNTGQDDGVWGGMSGRERRRVHGRRSTRREEGGLPALDDILQNRLGEFQALRAEGLEPFPIARALGTNVQTINRVVRVLEERAAKQGAGVAA